METGLPPGHRRCGAAAQRQIAVLLCALVAATLVLACAPGCGSPRTPAFYAEVDTVVPPELDPLSRLGISERRILTRWWYDPDPFRWRWEVEILGSVIDDGTVVTVVNGDDHWDDYWVYDDRSRSVRRGLMRVVPDGIMLLPTYNASVGPVRARTVDSLVDQLRESGDYSEVGLHGEATVLGRTTRVVGFRSPAYGVVRAWVDPERMFIMRWAGELEGSGGAYASEVTALEYDTEHDEPTFSVDPPADARADAMCDAATYPMVGVSGGAPSLPHEPGFLTPAYTPGGYRPVAAGSEEHASGGCGPVALWALLEAPDGAYLVLRQRLRPGGLPPVVRSWEAVDAELDDAHRHVQDGVRRLLWRHGDVVALLESASLSFGELIRVAESSSLVVPAPR